MYDHTRKCYSKYLAFKKALALWKTCMYDMTITTNYHKPLMKHESKCKQIYSKTNYVIYI